MTGIFAFTHIHHEIKLNRGGKEETKTQILVYSILGTIMPSLLVRITHKIASVISNSFYIFFFLFLVGEFRSTQGVGEKQLLQNKVLDAN